MLGRCGVVIGLSLPDGLGPRDGPAVRQMGQSLARAAVGASPRRQATIIGQELDRADMLLRITVPPVALMVAVD
jgi:hypothetical protein